MNNNRRPVFIPSLEFKSSDLFLTDLLKNKFIKNRSIDIDLEFVIFSWFSSFKLRLSVIILCITNL